MLQALREFCIQKNKCRPSHRKTEMYADRVMSNSSYGIIYKPIEALQWCALFKDENIYELRNRQNESNVRFTSPMPT